MFYRDSESSLEAERFCQNLCASRYIHKFNTFHIIKCTRSKLNEFENVLNLPKTIVYKLKV